MLLEGKKLLITGVLTDGSIAWETARIAQEEGAEVVLTGFGRVMRLTDLWQYILSASVFNAAISL